MTETKVITGKCRLSYVHVFEPVAAADGGCRTIRRAPGMPGRGPACSARIRCRAGQAASRSVCGSPGAAKS